MLVPKKGVGNKNVPNNLLVLLLICTTMIITLIPAREAPTVDIDPKELQVVSVGSQAMLYCTATGIPSPRVQWTRVDGQPLSPRHQMLHNEPGYIV